MTKMLIDRATVEQALEALEGGADSWQRVGPAIDALKAALAEPTLQTCNCRWEGEVQVEQCTLHEAHVDAIHEWAERAKTAEKKLAAVKEPVQEQAKPDHETRAEIAEQQVVQLAEERDHYLNLWLKAKQAEPVPEPDSPARRCGGPGCDGTCCQPVQEPMVSAGLGPLPEPAQPAEPEGYMPGCLWPLPAAPDYYTAEQMREYALRALAEPVQELVAQALCEADRIMGHDDEATEWRERWAHLFSCALTNGGYQCSCGASQKVHRPAPPQNKENT